MRLHLLLSLFIVSIFSGCAQNKLSNEFKGRIYVLESQENFFQLKEDGVASYYSIEEIGERNLSEHSASWRILDDTTLILTVKYEPKYENAEFTLKYNKEKDY